MLAYFGVWGLSELLYFWSVAPRGGSGIALGTDSAPALRTMSVAFLDGLDIGDNVRLDYGFDSQSISYLDRLNYVSPYMRLSYDAGPKGRVRLAYSSGAHPTERSQLLRLHQAILSSSQLLQRSRQFRARADPSR